MARFPRVYMENALYLVSSWADTGKTLFCDQADYERYLNLIKASKEKHGFKLFAYSLLPGGLELLIQPPANVSISVIMHSINSPYTKQYNSRYQRKGPVFNGRYRAVLVEKDKEYLVKLIKYIHLSPQRIELPLEPGTYPYTSYRYYRNPIAASPVNLQEEIREVLGYMGDVDTLYSDEDGKEMEELRMRLHRRAYIGSKHFINEVYNRLKAQKQERARVVRRPHKGFVLAGSILIALLAAGTVYFYTGKTELQAENYILQMSIDIAKQEFDKRYTSLIQEARINIEENTRTRLNGSEWEIRLTPGSSEAAQEPRVDRLAFRDGKFNSILLDSHGYPSSHYSVTVNKDGSIVWETLQTKPDGTTASWYGVWTGDIMKGVLSERYAQGGKRDFSFVSTNTLR